VEKNLLDKKATKDKRIQLSVESACHTIAYNSASQRSIMTVMCSNSLMREIFLFLSAYELHFMVNTDKEYMAGLKYIAGKYWFPQRIMIRYGIVLSNLNY
jgi:hypothetical protein